MLAALHVDRSRLEDLAAQILDLERSISALRTEQALVQQKLDAYKYPVLTLPNEITAEIFIHFLPVYPARPPLTGIDSPTSLTRICRKWRDVALATPALWRAIALRYRFGGSDKELEHSFEVWIRRSGAYPLSLEVQHATFAMCTSLVSCRARLEHLKFRGFPSTFSVIGGPMPLLRVLDLDLDLIIGVEDTFALSEVPLLRTVSLHGLAASIVTSIVTLPWAQLTSLALHGVVHRQIVAILEQTKNLISCELRFLTDDWPMPDVVLPRLESLVVQIERIAGRTCISILSLSLLSAGSQFQRQCLGLTRFAR
ncbi:hypothetical protein K438DRAFT_1839265 [Mycena galopus ATCC 62051]|nr:hypothetical protein K438DRAFT_1839265 [Mycena galopus ATCC 62051]